MIVETVTVVRDDHPTGRVDIDKSDLKKSDKLFTELKEAPKSNQAKNRNR